tara:strand:- start:810 stop:968 length:159 start_codon:yes stop_codon:yes gene_type:complete
MKAKGAIKTKKAVFLRKCIFFPLINKIICLNIALKKSKKNIFKAESLVLTGF